jgi:flagellar basal-body rod protein FlgB
MMTSSFLSDDWLRAAKLALNGLSRRQEVISHNLANIDTPGFQAQKVDFEGALQRALDGSQTIGLSATHGAHLGSPDGTAARIQVSARQGGSMRADGNNVDLDVELVQMAETELRYEALTRLVNKKFNLLREIASRR